jgi:hypothetical protein
LRGCAHTCSASMNGTPRRRPTSDPPGWRAIENNHLDEIGAWFTSGLHCSCSHADEEEEEEEEEEEGEGLQRRSSA